MDSCAPLPANSFPVTKRNFILKFSTVTFPEEIYNFS